MFTLRPDLMVDWDWERNTESPKKLKATSKYKAHWVCNKCGHRWSSRLDTRTFNGSGCPVCNTGGGSSVADYLLFLVVNACTDGCVSYRKRLEGYECDVFLEDEGICIEYDGCLFHDNVEKDEYKTNLWESKGYKVFRIKERDDEFTTYQIEDYVAFVPKMVKGTFELYKSCYLDILKFWCIVNTSVELSESIINVSKEEISSKIHSYAYGDSVKYYLDRCVTGLSWDYENNKLKPEDYHYESDAYANFICEFGHKFSSQVRSIGYGYGCPYCTSRRKEVGINDVKNCSYNISMLFPELRDEVKLHDCNKVVRYTCPVCKGSKAVKASSLLKVGGKANSSGYVANLYSCCNWKDKEVYILGRYKESIFSVVHVESQYYLVVTSEEDSLLKGYKESYKELDVDLFVKVGVAPLFKRTLNSTYFLPFTKYAYITYKDDRDFIKLAIGMLCNQKTW